jgi:hypothetical protein
LPLRLDCTLTLPDPKGLEAFLLAQFREVPARLARLADDLRPQIRALLGAALVASPEHASLLGGKLRQDFGLENPAATLADIVLAIQAAVSVEATPASAGGGLSVSYLPAGHADALSGGRGDASPVPWLQWLLFEGNTVVVPGYWRQPFLRPVPGSRAELSLMRPIDTRPTKKPRKNPREPFRVDPAFAGTAAENWLTRVRLEVAPAVGALVEAAARKAFS